MHEFKDFGIKETSKSFTGNKISLDRILNTKISVYEYKVEASTKKEGTKCLTLQIETDGEKRIIFTGSRKLLDMIEQVDKEKFPFITTIIKENSGAYKFT